MRKRIARKGRIDRNGVRVFFAQTFVSFFLALIFAANPCKSFASCPPPRFDTFCDKLTTYKWLVERSSGQENIQAVQEVMRSCGGAVQGIREVPFLNNGGDNEQTGPYLNRANDGFVYWDCGGYSNGPVNILSGSSHELLASIPFPYQNSRVVLSTTMYVGTDERDEDDNSISNIVNIAEKPSMSTRFFRFPPQTVDTPLPTDQSSSCALEVSQTPPVDIVWEKEIKCRMPSMNQPWILQRVLWERFEVNSGGKEDAENSDPEENVARIESESATRDYKEALGWILKGGPDVMAGNATPLGGGARNAELSSEEDLIVAMGACCPMTGDARVVVRRYQADGELGSVSLKEGRVLANR